MEGTVTISLQDYEELMEYSELLNRLLKSFCKTHDISFNLHEEPFLGSMLISWSGK